jgi:tRNA modification GTPase
MSEQDTICGVSTPAGEGGIGIIRISGERAVEIASSIFRKQNGKSLSEAASHTLHYGHVVSPDGNEIIDEALVSVMRAPATYTREDVVEINCHGGMLPLARTLALAVSRGARQSEPGEFTKRAFLNGRIDLSQAEAVMDVIRSRTEFAHKAANEQLLGHLSSEVQDLRNSLLSIAASVEAAVDFPEEDIELDSGQPLRDRVSQVLLGIDAMLSSVAAGRILREGFGTAIVGSPNVGKSSLLNALLRSNRAIVTDIPGTTRDVLEEYLNIQGVPVKILDTAGIRHAHDVVEQEGVRRSLAAVRDADIVLVVLDGSRGINDEDRRVLKEIAEKPAIAVINKSDLPRVMAAVALPEIQVSVSCRSGQGLDELRAAIASAAMSGTRAVQEHGWAINQRHRTALEQAKESLNKVLESDAARLSPEFIALDLRVALDSLGLVIGATYTDDILNRIFDDFCIGK